MKPMLDATAGNRMIWGKNKNQDIDNCVFIDIEYKLAVPPDIFASSEYAPFRDGVFSCVIFDPPWGLNMPPWWFKPESKGNFYGNFTSKRKMIKYLDNSRKEFTRLTQRVCMKWGERNVSLWSILGIFTRNGWNEVFRKETNGIDSQTKNYWITLVRTKTINCAEDLQDDPDGEN